MISFDVVLSKRQKKKGKSEKIPNIFFARQVGLMEFFVFEEVLEMNGGGNG